jgi:hypothetical protein
MLKEKLPFDERLLKVQACIQGFHDRGKPAPSCYPDTTDLAVLRPWLLEADRRAERLEDRIRAVAAMPEDDDG